MLKTEPFSLTTICLFIVTSKNKETLSSPGRFGFLTEPTQSVLLILNFTIKKGSCKGSEFAKFALKKSDVIITKDSETPDDIGVPTYVKDDLDSVVCGYHLTMLRPLTCHGEYIFRFIQSDRTRRYFEVNSNGITRYGLGKASIENLLLPIPTDSEQQQIADFLNNKTQQIDELITAEQRKIELLKEYWQSLISEAVTGKIDVRNEV